MAIKDFSAISGLTPFDPAIDVFHIDDISLSASDFILSSPTVNSTRFVGGGKTITLQTTPIGKLTSTNVIFDDGSLLRIGDASIGRAADSLGNSLIGGAYGDQLIGLEGNDTLNGAAGGDRMVGGAGNDIYIVDNPTDVVVEVPGEGDADLVKSAIDYTLGANLEDLELIGGAITGTGNDGDNVITGNSSNNSLFGGNGHDALYGGGGRDTLVANDHADSLYGGGGNDVLVPFSQFDVLEGGAGADTVKIASLDLAFSAALGDRIPESIEVVHLTSRFGYVILGAQQLLDMSSTDSLRVFGGDENAVIAAGSWIRGADTVVGGQTYAQYTQGAATLQIDIDMNRSGVGHNNIDLLHLNGTDGFEVVGPAGRDASGLRVSDVGDVNGDGFDDFGVGGGSVYVGGTTYLGSGFVILGSAVGSGSSLDLSTANPQEAFRLATDAGSVNQYSIIGLGDVNGDGLDDLAVGVATKSGSPDDGLYVIYGSNDGFASIVDITEGALGARLSGAGLHSIGSAGDLNGDGYDDVIIRSETHDYLVVFGGPAGLASSVDASTLDGVNGFRITDSSSYIPAAHIATTAAVGDVDGDGIDDLLIGNYASDLGGAYSGSAYVVFGHTTPFGSELDLAALNGLDGFAIPGGASAGNALGEYVSAAGDFNGDGLADILVETPGPGPYDSGTTYVIFGNTSGFGASLDPAELNGTNGFAIAGYPNSRARVSAAAGDVNADGYDDVILADFEGFAGDKAYVVFGSADMPSAKLSLSDLNGMNGFVLTDLGDGFSKWVGGGGDVNGDGFADIIIGAPSHIPDGASYVVYGRDFTGDAGLMGTSSDDTLTGSGGAQVIKGGAGDDRIRAPDLDFFRIDAGSGTDVLVLTGNHLDLDFGRLDGNALRGIEKISLNGRENTLTLTGLDVLNLSDTSNVLTVAGTGADTVDLGADGWALDHAGAGFEYYVLGGATLRIDSDITVIGIT